MMRFHIDSVYYLIEPANHSCWGLWTITSLLHTCPSSTSYLHCVALPPLVCLHLCLSVSRSILRSGYALSGLTPRSLRLTASSKLRNTELPRVPKQ
ncbi:hypothetical protein E2C01_037636 [Portunus trituberculatus]|uniref:Uncharacterized protein n=1 Tax=Portunus trituberculatus TaxID=210409 RepID=A0A5B7FG58_PORTR|nr:hypothetical protein [Portunus trituberculatus]